MKKNYVAIASVLIICAAVLIYLTAERDNAQAPQRLHSPIDPADMHAVIIARGDQRTELVPRGTTWYLRDNDLLITADASALLNLLEFINTAAIVQRVSSNPDTYSRFDLAEDSALRVTLQTADDNSTVYIGKRKDHATQFVRLPEDPAVYLASQTLETGPEHQRWHYRRVLHYAPEMFAAVDYECTPQTLRLERNAETGIVTVSETPEDRLSADLQQVPEYFRDMSVGEFIPRDQAPETEARVTHTVHFTDGSFARLRFIDRDDERDRSPYLDILFGGAEPTDEQLRSTRDICARYVFALSWVDPSKYLKNCDEFFTDALPAPAAE
jgi:hypothetical protein